MSLRLPNHQPVGACPRSRGDHLAGFFEVLVDGEAEVVGLCVVWLPSIEQSVQEGDWEYDHVPGHSLDLEHLQVVVEELEVNWALLEG